MQLIGCSFTAIEVVFSGPNWQFWSIGADIMKVPSAIARALTAGGAGAGSGGRALAP